MDHLFWNIVHHSNVGFWLYRYQHTKTVCPLIASGVIALNNLAIFAFTAKIPAKYRCNLLENTYYNSNTLFFTKYREKTKEHTPQHIWDRERWRSEYYQLVIFFMQLWKRIGPRHEISNNVVSATSKGSDQPAHMRSLIRAFASHLNIPWVLSYWLNIIWSVYA